MSHTLISKNESLRIDLPLRFLFCFAAYIVWQMGVIYFSGTALSVYGRTPLPMDIDRVTLLIAIGYIVSILFMILFPKWIVWAERILALIALVCIVVFFIPLPDTVLLLLYYIHIFCCITMIGFENALMVHLFTEKSILKHLCIAYPLANLFIAFLHNDLFPVPFYVFHLMTIIGLVLLILFSFKLPGNLWPEFASKKDRIIYPKRLHYGVYIFSLVGGLLTLLGQAISETMPYGISLYYLSSAFWLFLLYILWKYKSIHPLRSVSFYAGISALGFLTALASLYISDFQIISIILLAAGISVLSLYPFMQYIMFRHYPSRFVSPIIIFMALMSVLVQSTLLDIFRDNIVMLYTVFLIIAVGATLFYLVIEPYLVASFEIQFAKMTESPTYAEKYTQEVSFTEHLNANAFDKISPRERELAELILLGYTNSEMAEKLGLTLGTIKVYRKNLYSKLQIHSKRELFALADTYKKMNL